MVNIEISGKDDPEDDKNIKDLYGGNLHEQDKTTIPNTWAMDIGHNTQLKVDNNIPIKNYNAERIMHRFRFIVILNEMRDIPNS